MKSVKNYLQTATLATFVGLCSLFGMKKVMESNSKNLDNISNFYGRQSLEIRNKTKNKKELTDISNFLENTKIKVQKKDPDFNLDKEQAMTDAIKYFGEKTRLCNLEEGDVYMTSQKDKSINLFQIIKRPSVESENRTAQIKRVVKLKVRESDNDSDKSNQQEMGYHILAPNLNMVYTTTFDPKNEIYKIVDDNLEFALKGESSPARFYTPVEETLRKYEKEIKELKPNNKKPSLNTIEV